MQQKYIQEHNIATIYTKTQYIQKHAQLQTNTINAKTNIATYTIATYNHTTKH